jgi:glutathione S-transferase
MLTLCQLPSGPAIPNYSPFCMKVECVLRMLDLDYQIQHVDSPQAGPRGQVPFIIDDGETIGDSRVIVEHLQRKHGLDLDRHLDPLQRATGHAMQVMIEQHLYFALVHGRWADDATWPQVRALFFAGVPEEIAEGARQWTVEKVQRQGLGRHTAQQIAAFAAADIAAAATLLADTPFVFGEIPGLTDAVLYAFVANLTAASLEIPLRTQVLAHDNLVAHAERMRSRYFPMVPAMAA